MSNCYQNSTSLKASNTLLFDKIVVSLHKLKLHNFSENPAYWLKYRKIFAGKTTGASDLFLWAPLIYLCERRSRKRKTGNLSLRSWCNCRSWWSAVFSSLSVQSLVNRSVQAKVVQISASTSKSTVDWEEINPHVPLYMKHAPWYAKSRNQITWNTKENRKNHFRAT